MLMPMMHIRKVRMTVSQRRVLMHMTMGFSTVPLKVMLMPMVFVMNMAMAMFEEVVLMFVGMVFSQVNPHAQGHECGSD